jgi:hypothetical protein
MNYSKHLFISIGTEINFDFHSISDEYELKLVNDSKNNNEYASLAYLGEFSELKQFTLGYVDSTTNEFKSSTFKIDDKYTTEKELLTILVKCLKQFYQKYPVLNGYMLFDYITPFLIKRLIVNGFSLNELPAHLTDYTKKPWEKINFCLYDFWKFGSYNKSATMYILCKLFNVEFDIHNINSETFLKSYFSLIEKIFKKNTI